ncbi:MAG: hypothetical protein GF368_02760 [Candidatus Aenigmarchaeota archaeon]|nr:hypothetical protein [Candidatus Aenigmarchaeota archaeon]
MKPEKLFGSNAGKVWGILANKKKPLSAYKIMKLSDLKRDDVLSGLGWLGKEGKIEVLENGKSKLYKLT